jgi:Na+/melibiose symporter-like transporter
MDLLVIIFSGAALLGVGISLVGFIQKVPRQERIAVVALIAVGGVLLVVLAVFAATSATNSNRHGELCDQANANREAILTLTVVAERNGTSDPALSRIDGLLDGPVC